MYLTMIAETVGGLGLFMLGMLLMTDGLKLAAGHTLRSILKNSTRTPLRGILSGALITSLVQSSSAVTVATIGFVNAGLLNLGQAILLIYGSNIGTTTTGWLVAVVGFHVNIKAFALPAVGLGMLIRIVAGERRYTGAGEALAGFGVFFLGIEVLKNTLGGLGGTIQLEALAGGGALSLLLFTGAGIILTFLMQSSSAAMAIVLTAAGSNLISINAAAAVVVGANLGTTTTAMLATIGATSNAKRVAAGHVIFNLATGLLALLFLPLLISFLLQMLRIMEQNVGPATVLALFHTTFNLIGVILFTPLTRHLVRFLEKQFRVAEEDEGTPRFLDRNVVTTPTLALHAMAMELTRIGVIARRMAMGAISSERRVNPQLKVEMASLTKLIDAIGEFSSLVQQKDLSPEIADQLPIALRISRYYESIAELSSEISTRQGKIRPIKQEELIDTVAKFKKMVVTLLEEADTSLESYVVEECTEKIRAIAETYQEVKSALLRAGAVGHLSARNMVDQLEVLSETRRIAEQAEKGARFLYGLDTFQEKNKDKDDAKEEEEANP